MGAVQLREALEHRHQVHMLRTKVFKRCPTERHLIGQSVDDVVASSIVRRSWQTRLVEGNARSRAGTVKRRKSVQCLHNMSRFFCGSELSS